MVVRFAKIVEQDVLIPEGQLMYNSGPHDIKESGGKKLFIEGEYVCICWSSLDLPLSGFLHGSLKGYAVPIIRGNSDVHGVSPLFEIGLK